MGIYHFLPRLAPATRTALINHLIYKHDLASYLEIGVRRSENFNQIAASRKVGVDPEPLGACDCQMTSNAYFASLDQTVQFDLISINDLHTKEQAERNIDHALKHLSADGFVLLHDCNPPTEFHERERHKADGRLPPWNGTTWKAFVRKRCIDPFLEMCVVDTGWGVGIIRRGRQGLYPVDANIATRYPHLQQHHQRALNLISVETFLKRY